MTSYLGLWYLFGKNGKRIPQAIGYGTKVDVSGGLHFQVHRGNHPLAMTCYKMEKKSLGNTRVKDIKKNWIEI